MASPRNTMKCLTVLLLVAAAIQGSSARILDKCQLAHELLRQGFPRNQLENWVCLVQSESGGDTSIIGTQNTDESKDHGLFQISDKFWCTNKGVGGACKVNCKSLRTDDISEASECAHLIFKEHQALQGNGFLAWEGWKKRCQGALPDLSECFDTSRCNRTM